MKTSPSTLVTKSAPTKQFASLLYPIRATNRGLDMCQRCIAFIVSAAGRAN